MKHLAVLTTALLALAVPLSAGVAYAAQSETAYPEDEHFIKPVVFSALTDYAVNGENFAFAEGKVVSVYEAGNYTSYAFEKGVIRLDCKGGTFYCYDGTTAYSLPDKKACEYSFGAATTSVAVGDSIYHFNSESKLCYYNLYTMASHVFEGEYSNLKSFDGKVYAVKDNCVCTLDGTVSTKIELEYADFSSTQNIAVGKATEKLKSYSPARFVGIKSGAFMTEIDLIELDGEFFTPINTAKTTESQDALLLCYTGNAAIVAIGDTAYITLTSNVTEKSVNCLVDKEFSDATVIGDKIYASPYVIIGTATSSDAAGKIVKVLNKLEYTDVLGSTFYEVEYTTETGTAKGFVAAGFLTEYIIEDNKQPTTVTDPNYSEKDDTKTMLLILAVIVLVMSAIGYLAYVSTGDKRKKKKKEKPQQEK